MALATTLVPSGLHHAVSQGNVVAGAGFGEVAGAGAAQLCRFLLPYPRAEWSRPGFEDQLYVVVKSLDGNVTNAVLDAQALEPDPGGELQIARLRLDVAALPADVQIWFEAHHSTGR